MVLIAQVCPFFIVNLQQKVEIIKISKTKFYSKISQKMFEQVKKEGKIVARERLELSTSGL